MELVESDNRPESSKTFNISASMAATLRESCLPGLLDGVGPYDEVESSLANVLAQDFRLNQDLLLAVAELFAGAIIHDGSTILVLTCEVYSRSLQLDRHAESSWRSLPAPGQLLFCEVIADADGHGLKKLVIGTNTINILCTSTVVLGDQLKVFVGPGWHRTLSTMIELAQMTNLSKIAAKLEAGYMSPMKNCRKYRQAAVRALWYARDSQQIDIIVFAQLNVFCHGY